MAKAAALLFALCIVAIATFPHGINAAQDIDVTGEVFCDPCRFQFLTHLSQPMSGATVLLECRDRENGTVTFSAEAESDDNGKYIVPVTGDHELDICEVSLLRSTRDDCNQIFHNDLEKSRVVITTNSGMKTLVRYANPLFYMTATAADGCKAVLEEMGFIPYDSELH